MKKTREERVTRTLFGKEALRYARREGLYVEVFGGLPRKLVEALGPLSDDLSSRDVSALAAGRLIREGAPEDAFGLTIGLTPGHEEERVLGYLREACTDNDEDWVLLETLFDNVELSSAVVTAAVMRLMAKDVLEAEEEISTEARLGHLDHVRVRFVDPRDSPISDEVADELIRQLLKELGASDQEDEWVSGSRKRFYLRALHHRLSRST